MLDEFKKRMIDEIQYILFGSGKDIIYAYDLVVFTKQPFAKMPAYKACSTRNQYSFHLFVSIFAMFMIFSSTT